MISPRRRPLRRALSPLSPLSPLSAALLSAVLGVSSLAGCEQTPPEPTPAPRASSPAAAPAGSSASSSSASAAAPPSPPGFTPQRVAIEEKAMGTSVLLAAHTTPQMGEEVLREKLRKAFAEIQRLELLMTTWREDSEISRVNAAAGKKAVPVGPESLAVIQKSLWISQESGGVFDITFDAMRGLWKFDQDLEVRVPSKKDIDERKKLIDYRKIKVDEAKSSVLLEKAGMRMNLGGIAKGYAIDAAARILKAEGLASFFAQAGGDLYVAGKKPDGSRWRVGIRDPRGKHAGDYFAMLEVEDHAFSTAGDYERSFILDGKRYHHIIDPRTGYPATENRSVTIWAGDAFTADAIDDAVFILGAERGLALVESLPDCGAVIVDAKNKVWISKRLKDRVQVLRPPTDGI
jgi:thiamine biosynthesis lipoprotein